MRKCIMFVIVSLLLLVSFSVSASCNLNPERWEWINFTDTVGTYVDKYTIKRLSYNVCEFWMAQYCPYGCEIYDGENYHFTKCYMYFDENALAYSSGIVCDSKGNVIKEWSNKHLKYLKLDPIYSGSISEDVAVFLHRMVRN